MEFERDNAESRYGCRLQMEVEHQKRRYLGSQGSSNPPIRLCTFLLIVVLVPLVHSAVALLYINAFPILEAIQEIGLPSTIENFVIKYINDLYLSFEFVGALLRIGSLSLCQWFRKATLYAHGDIFEFYNVYPKLFWFFSVWWGVNAIVRSADF